ncbi:MAG: hypothetical protein Q7R87_02685 [Nanoarchaeota archaeon]|nr:hypothetical protein [Nanoarchaeota archaeon]
MHKRESLVFLALLFSAVLLSSTIVIAQDSSNSPELSESAGITPDSSFYFVEDSILTKFRDDSSNREKKIAEVKAMINEGKIAEARTALAKYKEFADRLEKEVSPDKQEEAKRSAEAIRAVISEIESEIPEADKEDFVDSVVESEKRIETAAEIASKIKDLCETLAKIDPDQYSRTCKSGEDSPAWQKKLDKDLTDEQKKEAKVFIQVMTQCFKDATNCKCQDISVKSFADKCSEVVPLYAQCQKGDETKCEEADAKSEGIEELLPDYLQEIMADLDKEYSGAQFENHMPQECQEANVKTEKECMQIMVRVHAPEECISALDSEKIKFENERQFRKDCEEIMFKESAPQECIDAGIKDGRECGKFMFKESAPQECIDAGLTGDKPSDHKKCREIMDKLQGGRENNQGQHQGGGFNFDCRKLENSEERLKCFDSAVSSYKEGPGQGEGRQFNEQEFRKIKDKERECANSCTGGRWDFSGGECRCEMPERREEFRDDRRFENERQFDQNRQMSEEDRRRFEDEMRQRFEQDRQRFEGQQPPNQEQFNNQQGPPPGDQPPSLSPPPSDSSGSTSSDSPPPSDSTSSSTGTSDSSTSSSSGSGSGITGGAIVDITKDNNFLNYFFRK